MGVGKTKDKSIKKSSSNKKRVQQKDTQKPNRYSPAWVVANSGDSVKYNMEIIAHIRKGVKKSDWKQLIHDINSTEQEFKNILPASISSMQKKEVYSKETSEWIYELARLFGLGYEVFDSKEKFKLWLMTPSRALGNKIPFDLLDSSFGFQMVEDEIIRIEYSVYS